MVVIVVAVVVVVVIVIVLDVRFLRVVTLTKKIISQSKLSKTIQTYIVYYTLSVHEHYAI